MHSSKSLEALLAKEVSERPELSGRVRCSACCTGLSTGPGWLVVEVVRFIGLVVAPGVAEQLDQFGVVSGLDAGRNPQGDAEGFDRTLQAAAYLRLAGVLAQPDQRFAQQVDRVAPGALLEFVLPLLRQEVGQILLQVAPVKEGEDAVELVEEALVQRPGQRVERRVAPD